MSSRQLLLRAVGVAIALALIAGAFFNLTRRDEPKPLFRLDTPQDTPQATASPAQQGLNFSAPGLDGKNVNLSSYRGHPVIVDFWATWCGPCRKQIPELVSLYRRYNKTRGLVIIGVSCDVIQGDGAKAVEPFVEEFRINYPIALADERLVDTMGVEAIPTTLFISPDGELVSRIVGAGHAGEISESTRMLLDGVKGPSRPS